MLDLIKDASRLVLIPSIVLYALGFICVTAFLARFGIISFDIINARYAIAGLYPLLALMGVIYIAWNLYIRQPISNYFDIRLWKIRFLTHGMFISFTVVASTILLALMSFGKYKPPSDQSVLVFKSFPIEWDFIGQQVTRLNFSIAPSFDYILKATLYGFSYIFILVLIAILVFIVWHNFFSKAKSPEINLTDATNDEKVDESINKDTSLQKEDKEYPAYLAFLIITVDFLFICLYISLVIYSYGKLGVAAFDFSSLGDKRSLTTGLLFAWIFTSILYVYLFLNMVKFPTTQLTLDVGKNFGDFNNIQWTFQYLIIPILLSIASFGYAIFPLIPFAMGGGEPRAVKIQTLNYPTEFKDKDLYLLGENAQFLFIAEKISETEGRAFQLNKSSVYLIETKTLKAEAGTEE